MFFLNKHQKEWKIRRYSRPRFNYEWKNQQKIIPMRFLQRVTKDIEGARAIFDFQVIETVGDSNPYPTLLGID